MPATMTRHRRKSNSVARRSDLLSIRMPPR